MGEVLYDREVLRAFRQLKIDTDNLEYRNYNALDAVVRRATMLIRHVFGDSSQYLQDLDDIQFSAGRGRLLPVTEEEIEYSWNRGRARLGNLLSTMAEELQLFGSVQSGEDAAQKEKVEQLASKSVFIVHGCDEEMKQSVARCLERLGLEAIILHEQPSQGRTIIEKLMDYGTKVSFAIVLLSPDDLAYSRDESPERARFRARQNVILELGLFLGMLGRSRVVALYREAKAFEMPSDYHGVLYVPYDRRGTWKLEVVRELKSAGYEIDANLLT